MDEDPASDRQGEEIEQYIVNYLIAGEGAALNVQCGVANPNLDLLSVEDFIDALELDFPGFQ